MKLSSTRKKNSFVLLVFLSIIFNSCQEKKSSNITAIPPQEVLTPDAIKKGKAEVTGERNSVEIGTKRIEAWSIIYKNDSGNLKSTIIKKDSLISYKKGDSIIIYYDSSNPIALPLSEKQFLELNKNY